MNRICAAMPDRRSGNRLTVPLTIGEVHTGLLLTSTAVPADTAAELLAIVPGRSVRTRQRPIRYAWSPEVLTGVDCAAPLAERREVRIVGTPATQLSLTDGRMIQAGTHATFRQDPAGRRRPWSHYLAQPGVLEVLGKASDESLAAGFLHGPATATALDLGAVNVRTLAAIQRSDVPRPQPAVSQSTRPGCAGRAETSDGEQEIVFTLGADGLRTVRLRAPEPDPRALADFCADLALHDWLLSTLLDIVDRAVARSRPAAELISMLRPGIDHLVHAWMPAAHVSRHPGQDLAGTGSTGRDSRCNGRKPSSGYAISCRSALSRRCSRLPRRRGRSPHDQRQECTGASCRESCLKVGFPLLIGLITLVAAHFGGMQVGNSLELAAVVAFARRAHSLHRGHRDTDLGGRRTRYRGSYADRQAGRAVRHDGAVQPGPGAAGGLPGDGQPGRRAG